MSANKVKWQVECISNGKRRMFKGNAGLGTNPDETPTTLASWIIGILEMLEQEEHLQDADDFQIIAEWKK